jgi:Fe-S-cluster containining protein
VKQPTGAWGASAAIEVFPCEIEGEVGLDVQVNDPWATVADLLIAMQSPADDPGVLKPFHKQRYARCAGCVNNCCKHNNITVDLVAAEELAETLGLSLQRFAREYLSFNPDLPFPELRRRPCPFLLANRCTVYQSRALICRLYLCTPMTDRLEQLRSAVSFAGEAALRQRLVELGLAPANWSAQALLRDLRQRSQQGGLAKERWSIASEYLNLQLRCNPFSAGKGYAEVLLSDCCADQLWQQLRAN